MRPTKLPSGQTFASMVQEKALSMPESVRDVDALVLITADDNMPKSTTISAPDKIIFASVLMFAINGRCTYFFLCESFIFSKSSSGLR